MFDSKSDYALNKLDREAIVCPSAIGVHIRLTREDFASEEEFLFWKELSDGDYHSTEKAETIQSNHTRSLQSLPDTPSAESVLVSQQEHEEREQLRRLLLQGMDAQLSPTQRRRLWLYCVEGQTVLQIAEAERVRHQSIVECLAATKKKLWEFLK